MDASRKSAARKNEEEEKDQQQTSPPKNEVKPKPRSGDAVFGRLGLDDAPDQLQYRSMTAVAPQLTFAMDAISGRPLMHGGMSGMMPTPFALRGGKAKNSGAKSVEAAPFSTTRVDRTNYVNLTPRDLPPPPFRLELHTHFHVKGEAIQRVCSVVGIKLSSLDTDFDFKSEKCKWKVEYRRDGTQRVVMNIMIFKSGKEYVVEVQRREGDIMALMNLYTELKMAFKSQQLLCEKDKPMTGLKRPAPRPLPKMPLSTANVSDAVSAIRGLLENRFVDAQMQGVLGAISLSTRDESRSAMSTLVPQLVALGHSKNSNVSKLVRVALARLCDHPECRQAFIESDGWEFIVKCAAGGSDVTAEVQRESLHVVECLCPLYSDELAKVEGASQVLELVQGWESIEDPRLKKHAFNAQRALREAGVIA